MGILPGFILFATLVLNIIIYKVYRRSILRQYNIHIADLYDDEELLKKVRRDVFRIFPFLLIIGIMGIGLSILLAII